MSSGHKTVTAFTAVIGGLILIILGLVLDWPRWIWPAAVTLSAGLAIAFVRGTTKQPDPLAREFTLEPDLPIAPPERREQTVQGVSLPTSAPDYDFHFSANVRWCPLEASSEAPIVNPGGLAVRAVLARAHEITATQPPHRTSFAQHELDGELGTMRPDPSGRVLAMAENVTLALSDADARRLERLATVRKEEEVWTHERKYECDRREYLGQDVLKDTGSAVVWWLSKNDDQVKQAVDEIGTLAQLYSAANNTDVPEQFRHMVPYPVPEPEPEPSEHFSHNGAGYTAGSFLGGSGLPGAEWPGTPSSPPPSEDPADHFGVLLEAIGVPDGDPDAAVLARIFADTAATLGQDYRTGGISDRFQPPSASAHGEDDEGKDGDNGAGDDGDPSVPPPFPGA